MTNAITDDNVSFIKKKIQNFIENENKASFSQNPKKWLENNGYSEIVFLLNEDNIQTRINMFSFAYGKGICKNCNKEHTRIIGRWKRGWTKTCCEECENELASKRQIGENNTSHRMTNETKNKMKEKMSHIMKEKIINGEFTPKSENYKTFGMIEFYHKNDVKKVRSLWELLFWIENENLEYEKIRIEYFDTLTNKNRIYITDFYDSKNNEIIEIKPTKYQDVRFRDKKIACEKKGYKFKTLDEKYFSKYKNDSKIISLLENKVINYDKIKGRIKWLKVK